jgi:Zn-dependent metalloprotease
MTSIGLRSRVAATASLAGLAVFLTFARPSAQAGGDAFSSQGIARAQAITTATASDVAEWDRRIAALERQGSLRLVASREDTMIAGRVHDRFDQYFGEARVFGAQIVRQRSEDGVVSIFGQVFEKLPVPTAVPKLTSDEAVERATAIAGREPIPGLAPQLVILPLSDGTFRLTWSMRIFSGRDLIVLFVDAATGEEAFRYSDMQTQQAAVGSGTGVLGDRKKVSAKQSGGSFIADDGLRPPALITYDLKGNPDRAYSILFGLPTAASDVATDTDNTWTDAAAVDAHVYLGFTYDYYFKRFERRGLDGNNKRVRGIVHGANRNLVFSYDEDVRQDFLVNAFWCGFCGSDNQGFMVFGDGIPSNVLYFGQHVDYLSGSPEVVAHELTHAVTTYTSDLIYMNESGALNEAFSDIMGVSADFYMRSQGWLSGSANYLIGEQVFTAGAPGTISGIRSMSNPASFGDPDHYSGRFTGTGDNGGVHINSAIPNQAFYLAIESGTNRTSGLAVTGVGSANREQIERIFYRAFTQFLPNNATFSIARQATLRAATDLYGGSSPAYRAVEQAWTAVGVQ